MEPRKAEAIMKEGWRIPEVDESRPIINGDECQEPTNFTSDRMYIPCGEQATMLLRDNRAGRSYLFCEGCGTHNLARGLALVKRKES